MQDDFYSTSNVYIKMQSLSSMKFSIGAMKDK